MTNEEIVKQIQLNINSTDNMESLYINNRPYIYKIAIKYSKYADIEDLMQEAYFGLYEAVQRYEDTHETKFMTFASFWFKQAIQRYIENNGNTVRIPVHLLDRTRKYKKIGDTFALQHGRKLTEQEIAALLNISLNQLDSMKEAIQKYDAMQSLDAIVPGTEGLVFADMVKDSFNLENDIIDRLMKDRVNSELWEIVRDNTGEIENKVICCRYQERLSLEETGIAIGESRDQARAIEYKAIRKLRKSTIRREVEERFEINYARAYRGSVSSFKYEWTSSTERAALKNVEVYN